jgi:hypothetical protein
MRAGTRIEQCPGRLPSSRTKSLGARPGRESACADLPTPASPRTTSAPAVPAPCCLEQPIKGRALGTAALQHESIPREFRAGHNPTKDRPLLWRDRWTREHD